MREVVNKMKVKIPVKRFDEILVALKNYYRIFAPVDGEEQFLGIGVFDDDKKHYKADKIFYIRG